MSQRMSRREMRKAGLLKPRPAADLEPSAEDPDPEDEGTQKMSAVPGEENAGSPASSHDEALEEDKVASYSDDAEDPDGEAVLGETVEVEPPAPVGAESAEDGQADDSPVSQAAPERTSVFDRFANGDENDAPSDDGPDSSGNEAFAKPVVKPEDTDGDDLASDDEDFAGALRAKLKSTPPGESSRDESTPDVADSDYPEAPSRWKTAVLFLLLIIVGFGVGILLGSLIFTSGAAEAGTQPVSLTSHLSHYYPGAL